MGAGSGGRSRRPGRGPGAALLRVGLGLVGLGLAACGTAPPPANVLVYVVDTLRVDGVGAYAPSHVETPAFDRMAREGVVFDDAFANSSWTRASVGSLFTGRFPRAHAARTRDDVLDDRVPTLAGTLRGHGYRTGFVSTNPNVSTVFGFGRGFDEVIELYQRPRSGRVGTRALIASADDVTDAAIGWIDRAQRPFLLVVHTIDPHTPYAPPPGFDASPDDPRAAYPADFPRGPLAGEARARVRALYDAEVRKNDAAFGSLLDALDARGIAEDTLLVLTSDHGEEFWDVRPGRRGHGNALSEAQLRVPLLVRFPRSPRVAPGTRRTGLVAGVDLMPTLLDLLGLPSPAGLDGRSAFDSAAAPTFASTELDGHRLYAIIDPPWKLVWDASRDEERLYRLHPGAGAPGAPVGTPAREPVADSAEHAERRAQLRRRLHAHLSSEGGSGARPRAGELPPDVRDALEVLGYLDGGALEDGASEDGGPDGAPGGTSEGP